MSTQQAVRDLPLLCSQTGSQRKIKISKNQNPGPWNLELAGSTLPPCKGLEEEIARKPHSFYDSVQKNSGLSVRSWELTPPTPDSYTTSLVAMEVWGP